MAINLKTKTVATREHRLGSITGYSGDLNDLASRSGCGNVKNRERCFSQSSTCLSGCAIGPLSGIRDAAIVYHAPSGCCAGVPGGKVLSNQIAARIGKTNDSMTVGTDLNERDTVFGAIEALRKIVHTVKNNYSPKAIFIASSCVSGVIGEDVDSLASELGDEFGIPVVPIHCEGFKSRIWASGFDIGDHAVMSAIVKPPVQKKPMIIFKNFFESHRPQITEIFAEFGVYPQFVYMNSTVEELSHLSEALATVCICGTLGTYLGNALEEQYGVPYIRTLNPSGIVGFETWLREIGKVIGKSAEDYIARERAIYLPQIEEVAKQLAGLTAVIGMGPGYTYEVSRVLQELGIKVVWAAAWHYDYHYDKDTGHAKPDLPPSLEYLKAHSPDNIPLSVTDQQNFEVLNILSTHKPDLYFSRHPGSTVWAIKQGIAALYVADEYMMFGYKGTLSFAKSILDTVRNRSFEKNLAAHVKLPYTEWWYKQENTMMLKEENA
jgi:nitrogenase molybdenum-iron protein alpha chain